jgi:hypothetical protein
MWMQKTVNQSVPDFAAANNHDDFVESLLEEGANESQVAEKNEIRFKELRQVMEVRKAQKMRSIGIPKRSQGLSSTQQTSPATRKRAGSIV